MTDRAMKAIGFVIWGFLSSISETPFGSCGHESLHTYRTPIIRRTSAYRTDVLVFEIGVIFLHKLTVHAAVAHHRETAPTPTPTLTTYHYKQPQDGRLLGDYQNGKDMSTLVHTDDDENIFYGFVMATRKRRWKWMEGLTVVVLQ